MSQKAAQWLEAMQRPDGQIGTLPGYPFKSQQGAPSYVVQPTPPEQPERKWLVFGAAAAVALYFFSRR
ncbi:MAG: hypothetical protein ACPGR8_06345 [Limisphaerales bacterium]